MLSLASNCLFLNVTSSLISQEIHIIINSFILHIYISDFHLSYNHYFESRLNLTWFEIVLVNGWRGLSNNVLAVGTQPKYPIDIVTLIVRVDYTWDIHSCMDYHSFLLTVWYTIGHISEAMLSVINFSLKN